MPDPKTAVAHVSAPEADREEPAGREEAAMQVLGDLAQQLSDFLEANPDVAPRWDAFASEPIEAFLEHVPRGIDAERLTAAINELDDGETLVATTLHGVVARDWIDHIPDAAFLSPRALGELIAKADGHLQRDARGRKPGGAPLSAHPNGEPYEWSLCYGGLSPEAAAENGIRPHWFCSHCMWGEEPPPMIRDALQPAWPADSHFSPDDERDGGHSER